MGKKAGGADRDRTGDLLTASQALSQLSYSPTLPALVFFYFQRFNFSLPASLTQDVIFDSPARRHRLSLSARLFKSLDRLPHSVGIAVQILQSRLDAAMAQDSHDVGEPHSPAERLAHHDRGRRVPEAVEGEVRNPPLLDVREIRTGIDFS
jgi:hypothetical protein